MVTYSDLTALIDVLAQKNDAEKVSGLKTVGILLDEITEYRKQMAQAGVHALMADLFKELGESEPYQDAAEIAELGLNRIQTLFGEVNVLLEKNEFACRFDLGEGAEDASEVIRNQADWLMTEMVKNGMDNYMNYLENKEE